MNKLLTALISFVWIISVSAAQPVNHILPIERLAPYCKTDYLRGRARLTQIKALDQLGTTADEKSQGCTKGSCFYHALRNGMILVKAVSNESQSAQHLAQLHDRSDLKQKLSFDGPWRSLIVANRAGTNSDMLTSDEAETLITYEKAQDPSFTTEVAIFDSRAPLNGLHLAGIDRIKAQLDQPNSVGLVLVFIGNQEINDAAKKADKKDVVKGHWIALIVNKAQGIHQYLLADSLSGSAPFTASKFFVDLIDKLEGTKGTIQAVVKYFPPQQKIEKDSSSISFAQLVKPLMYGIVSGAALFGISYYFKKNTAAQPQVSIKA